MSLVGNIEDLGLSDILQIVSLSKKSGVLYLSQKNRHGNIYFSLGYNGCGLAPGQLAGARWRSGCF